MNIFLSGTSSAGKTSILREFPKKYNTILLDDLLENSKFTVCRNKQLKNVFYTKKEKKEILIDCIHKKLIENLKEENVIDWVDWFDENDELLINKYLPNRFHVLVYTNIYDLVDNIIKRMFSEPRGVWLFEDQFAKYYMKTNNKKDSIDIINFNKFIKSLEKIKWEFESEKDLINFAKNVFNLLGINKINKEKDYYIKPRLNNYDLILVTKNKSPKELKDIILKNLNK
jgi:hypothetical protein